MSVIFNSRGEPVSPLDASLIPETILESLIAWGAHELPDTGGFVKAVLSGDLFDAVARADDGNVYALPAICSFIYNELPMGSWGSPEAVLDWRENGAAAGKFWKATREKKEARAAQSAVSTAAEPEKFYGQSIKELLDVEPGDGDVGVPSSTTPDDVRPEEGSGPGLGPDSFGGTDFPEPDPTYGEPLPWEETEGDGSA